MRLYMPSQLVFLFFSFVDISVLFFINPIHLSVSMALRNTFQKGLPVAPKIFRLIASSFSFAGKNDQLAI